MGPANQPSRARVPVRHEGEHRSVGADSFGFRTPTLDPVYSQKRCSERNERTQYAVPALLHPSTSDQTRSEEQRRAERRRDPAQAIREPKPP